MLVKESFISFAQKTSNNEIKFLDIGSGSGGDGVFGREEKRWC
jgi:16S rRNA G527 N7-methylase RsmG